MRTSLSIAGVCVLTLGIAACQTAQQSANTTPPEPAVETVQPDKVEKQDPSTIAEASTDTSVQSNTVQTQVAAANLEDKPAQDVATADTGAELVFLDFTGFDEDLSREMQKQEERIVVDVPAAFSLNDVPDRLDKWFSKIKQSGGYVQARQSDPDADLTRGIVGALIDLAVAAYEAQEAEELLEPAEDYNVLIEYDKQSGNADQVLFYRR